MIKQPEPIVETPKTKIIKEKQPKIIKEKPNYDNIPEDVIQNEINKRMKSAKDVRQVRHQDNIKILSVNIC